VRSGVPLTRLLSKLRVASRKDAQALVREGRVRVEGKIVTEGAVRVPPSARITIDDAPVAKAERRVIAFNKPRGTVTSRRDPEGRRTVFDVLGDTADGLAAVGRLDRASSGLLLLTTDTALADALTNPANAIVRRYLVTVRGRVDADVTARIEAGVDVADASGRPERLGATRVVIRKASGRETHLVVDLDEGRNREIRRLFQAVGHEVTRLHRVAFGAIELGSLAPGEWRPVTDEAIRATLGRVSGASAPPHATTRTPRRPPARTGASDSAASGASTRGGSRSR
jgi:23S rRNA pseudouridine2605 synthase